MKFDEVPLGQRFETAYYKVSKEEIIAFASQFDPQYMHLDEEKAKQSRFQGIIASGLHTLSMAFKLWVELGVFGEDVIAGTSMNNLKFIKPVYPDDVLHVIAEVTRKEERKRNGEVTWLLTAYNQNGMEVLSTEMSALIAK